MRFSGGKIKFIFVLIFSIGFVVLAIQQNYIPGIVFFGLCAIAAVFLLAWPFKRDIDIKEDWTKKSQDHGIFKYTEDGFIISGKTEEIAWKNIQTMLAYKIDLYTIDEIRLDIYCDNDISFSLSEDIAGWYVFIEKASQKFPTIDILWSAKIMAPAFEENLTLVHDRENRTLEQVTGDDDKSNL